MSKKMPPSDPMPIGVARMIVRMELQRILEEAGPNVEHDAERAIQALIDDAVKREKSLT